MQSLLYGFLFQLFQVELFFLFVVAGNGGTEHEVVVLQLFLVGKDDGPFNDMLQFAPGEKCRFPFPVREE